MMGVEDGGAAVTYSHVSDVMAQMFQALKCSICLGLLSEPYSAGSNCRHNFCKACILKHLEWSKHCPTCRVTLSKRMMVLDESLEEVLEGVRNLVEAVGLDTKGQVGSPFPSSSTHKRKRRAYKADGESHRSLLFLGSQDDDVPATTPLTVVGNTNTGSRGAFPRRAASKTKAKSKGKSKTAPPKATTPTPQTAPAPEQQQPTDEMPVGDEPAAPTTQPAAATPAPAPAPATPKPSLSAPKNKAASTPRRTTVPTPTTQARGKGKGKGRATPQADRSSARKKPRQVQTTLSSFASPIVLDDGAAEDSGSASGGRRKSGRVRKPVLKPIPPPDGFDRDQMRIAMELSKREARRQAANRASKDQGAAAGASAAAGAAVDAREDVDQPRKRRRTLRRSSLEPAVESVMATPPTATRQEGEKEQEEQHTPEHAPEEQQTQSPAMEAEPDQIVSTPHDNNDSNADMDPDLTETQLPEVVELPPVDLVEEVVATQPSVEQDQGHVQDQEQGPEPDQQPMDTRAEDPYQAETFIEDHPAAGEAATVESKDSSASQPMPFGGMQSVSLLDPEGEYAIEPQPCAAAAPTKEREAAAAAADPDCTQPSRHTTTPSLSPPSGDDVSTCLELNKSADGDANTTRSSASDSGRAATLTSFQPDAAQAPAAAVEEAEPETQVMATMYDVYHAETAPALSQPVDPLTIDTQRAVYEAETAPADVIDLTTGAEDEEEAAAGETPTPAAASARVVQSFPVADSVFLDAGDMDAASAATTTGTPASRAIALGRELTGDTGGAQTFDVFNPTPTQPEPTPTTPQQQQGEQGERRPPKASSGAGMVILTTSLTRKFEKQLQQFVREHGARLVSEFTAEVTHVVTKASDDLVAANRTMKFMKGICTGKWVLSEAWARACFAAGAFVGERPYEIVGEGEFVNEGPRRSREATAGGVRLLAGYSVCPYGVFGDISRDKVEDLLRTAGATVVGLPALKAMPGSAKRLILCDSDAQEVDEEKILRETGIEPTDVYWLYDSVAAYELHELALYAVGQDCSQEMFGAEG